MYQSVKVIGGGLAGSEAAWQVARHGVHVILYEMRPRKMTPAHRTGQLAELVCSNSLKSESLENAAGLLKEEMRILGSLIIGCASRARIPAGSALAVNRDIFSTLVTETLEGHPGVTVAREEVTELPEDEITIVATGPLTSEGLQAALLELVGGRYLYFYDAVAPIITRESIDFSKAFWASRYGKGDKDYVNCPMTKEEYDRFWEALVDAEVAPLHRFEDMRVFEGCMPIEEMARRGREALTFGPLKPVGLVDPATGVRPYAVVQLRKENDEGTMLNMVGFQTRLRWREQERVFHMIPGLEGAEFIRFGVMHRNTFINSPELLKPTLQLRERENLFFAGQITGVEGYVESAASGLLAGINAARLAKGLEPLIPPEETMHGALCRYITTSDSQNFQPMGANFGLLPPLSSKAGKRDRRKLLSKLAIQEMKKFEKVVEIGL